MVTHPSRSNCTTGIRGLLSAIVFAWLWNSAPAFAQLIPDQSLPENSRLLRDGSRIHVEGGTQAGGNLFHSFQEFSIPQDLQVHFDNAASIERIITRVTGGEMSQLDGHLSANGAASFILVNPQGIEFGERARLSLGGMFMATTAEGLQFADGSIWGTSPSETSTLLTVSTPVGVQFGDRPGPILNRSLALDDQGTPMGLGALRLSLLGGEVHFEGGQARSPLSVTVGSFGPGTVVGLDGQGGIAEVNSQELGTIRLSRQGGIGGGAIRLLGDRLEMTEGAQVVSLNPGTIAIDMTESVHLDGESQMISLNGPDLEIQTGTFRLENGSRLVASQGNEGGQGGAIRINAREAIVLRGVGFEPFNLFLAGAATGQLDPEGDTIGGIFSFTTAGQGGDVEVTTGGDFTAENGVILFLPSLATGDGGNLTLEVGGTLSLNEGAIVNATTLNSRGVGGDTDVKVGSLRLANGSTLANLTLGDGPAGDISIQAQHRVEVLDSRPDAFVPTGIFNNSLFGSGPAGDITIETGDFINRGGGLVTSNTGGTLGGGLVTEGGPGGNISITAENLMQIVGVSADGQLTSGPGTTTFGVFPAGNLTLNTRRLEIGDGAIVSTATVGAGDAGTLTVNAREVEVFGRSPITGLPSILVSSSGRGDVPLDATGEGGDLRLVSDRLTVRDGAVLDVRSFGSGSAGLLDIQARDILLDGGGSLSAATVTGLGGNIQVRSQNLQLRRGSGISTNAGSTDGGNIRLDTATLVALENSDITANALEGRGGRVSITAEGIFGTEFREVQTDQSDITATSALGAEFSGIVEINTPDADSTAGLVELETDTTDPSEQIVRDCLGQDNRFSITGRGGRPEDPQLGLATRLGWRDQRDWRTLTGEPQTPPPQPQIQTPPLQEATTWVMSARGQVSLVSQQRETEVFLNWSCP